MHALATIATGLCSVIAIAADGCRSRRIRPRPNGPLAGLIGGICACLTLISGCAADRPLPPSKTPIALDHVPLQYDDNVHDAFVVSPAEWRAIVALFADARDGASERASIALAVAQLERIAGEQTPIGKDGRKNYGRGVGKADCLDESTNTTTFLRLMREQRLLRYNRVMEKALRGPFQIDIHWTAVVQDLQTREKWVIDSWYNANGIPPIVQPLDDWMRKQPVPGYYAEAPTTEEVRASP